MGYMLHVYNTYPITIHFVAVFIEFTILIYMFITIYSLKNIISFIASLLLVSPLDFNTSMIKLFILVESYSIVKYINSLSLPFKI